MTRLDDRRKRPICPICWQECEKIYRFRDSGDVVGCDECIDEIDAWDYLDAENEP